MRSFMSLVVVMSLANCAFAELPVLEVFLFEETSLERDSKPFHIGNQIRAELRDAAIQEISAEDEENKKIESLPSEIAKTKDTLAQKRQELKRLDAAPEITIKKEQDEYNRAFSYYKKYFKSKSMLDEERQEEIDFVTNRLRESRGENPELQEWLSILLAQQENESRSLAQTSSGANEDNFGIEREVAKDERSSQEKQAWDEVNQADELFEEISPKDLNFDYDRATVLTPAKLGNLKSIVSKYQALEKLLADRLRKKSAQLKPSGDELEISKSVELSFYPKEFSNLALKGTANDLQYLDELLELRRDISAIAPLLEAITKLRPTAKANNTLIMKRAELISSISEEEALLSTLEANLHNAKLNKNHFAYLSLAKSMDFLSDKIREAVKGGQDPVKSDFVRKYRIAFLALMHRLESFELELSVKYGGNDPYSSQPMKKSIKSVINFFKGQTQDFFLKDKRPQKKQLMRNYQLALHGLDGFYDAFRKTFAQLKSTIWDKNPNPLKDYIQLSNVTKVISSIERFGIENPILASDLQRNLSHAYKVFMQNPKTGLISEVFESAKLVYDIKEMENISRDWLLGSAEYLYSEQNLGPPLSVEILTLVDIAEMAPYLAGAYVGATGGGTVAGWAETMVSWVPVVGNYKPVKVLAKALGGVAQVHAQKLAASQISRKNELLVNTLRTGFTSYFDGKSPKDIAIAVVKYQAMRKIIQTLGTARKLGAANVLKTAGQCLKDNKAPAAVGAGLGLGGGTLIGAAAITAGGAAIVPILIPVLATVGCAVGAVVVTDYLKDFFIPGRREARKMQALAKQLQAVSLPTIQGANSPELTANELSWAQTELPKAIQNIDFKALGAKAKGQEDLQDIVMNAIQEKLEEQELRHAEEQAARARLDNVYDVELTPLKEKLDTMAARHDITDIETSGLIKEALKMVGESERMDAFELNIFNNLSKMQSAVKERKQEDAKALLAKIQSEVRLLRVRQMEAGLVNTYEALQR